MSKRHPALLDGRELLGDVGDFACVELADTPATRDAFLGYDPGTSTDPTAPMYAVSGAFYGAEQAVQDAIDALAGLAGVGAMPFGYPTTLRFPDDFVWSPHWCRFLADDFVPGAIVAYSGGTWTAPFRLVLRQVV